jgi:HSP20 family molecular chaperone IbpA
LLRASRVASRWEEVLPARGTLEKWRRLLNDVRSTRYRRSFVLSRDLDRDKIAAKLKDGVLTLHIPKREEVRPRKIAVRTG